MTLNTKNDLVEGGHFLKIETEYISEICLELSEVFIPKWTPFKSKICKLTRAWQGYFYNTADREGVFFTPLGTQELLVGFTKFKERSIDLENLPWET